MQKKGEGRSAKLRRREGEVSTTRRRRCEGEGMIVEKATSLRNFTLALVSSPFLLLYLRNFPLPHFRSKDEFESPKVRVAPSEHHAIDNVLYNAVMCEFTYVY